MNDCTHVGLEDDSATLEDYDRRNLPVPGSDFEGGMQRVEGSSFDPLSVDGVESQTEEQWEKGVELEPKPTESSTVHVVRVGRNRL